MVALVITINGSFVPYNDYSLFCSISSCLMYWKWQNINQKWFSVSSIYPNFAGLRHGEAVVQLFEEARPLLSQCFIGGLGGAGAPPSFSALPPGICWYDAKRPGKVRLSVFNGDFSSLFLSTRSWPNNVNISRMVYGITIRLTGMKAVTDSDCTRTHLWGSRI